MTTFSTYWHTLRYLKPIQIYGRLRYKLYRPRVDLTAAPLVRERAGIWVGPILKPQSMYAPNGFCFLNKKHLLLQNGWDSAVLEKLWRYNLHYFDDLNSKDAAERVAWHRDLLLQWVRENPPASGTGWEPYPTSLRIVNWIKWALAGNTLPSGCLLSLAVQARWLSSRLEYHLLGNHLFSNAKALVYAGAFFSGSEAGQWLNRGLAILVREIPEQILTDGGQFERSTMYHALALDDLLDLINLSRAFPTVFSSRKDVVNTWANVVDQMSRWLRVMTHPDGEISFFNDATMGIAPSPAELFAYGQRIGISFAGLSADRISSLTESGYFRAESDNAVFLVDVAPVGPDYLPGHAHADTLSFELSVFGQRVFVNSGIGCYGDSPERLRQRGTAAHNTVMIDGQNSSEVWGSFRVARRAKPKLIRIYDDGDHISIEASHDGFRRLPGKNIHSRKWVISPGKVVIQDEIMGRFSSAEARFHLHPDVEVDTQLLGEGQVKLQLFQGANVDFSIEGGVIHMEFTTWHPGFGISVPNACIVVTFKQARVITSISWYKAA